MLDKKEIAHIIAVSVIIAFSSTVFSGLQGILTALVAVFLVFSINTFSKKLVARQFEMNVKTKIWEFRRYGYKEYQKFRNKFPAGAILPIIFAIIFFPLGGFIWMGSTVFSVSANPARVAKRHGYYSFSAISENHVAIIAGTGIITMLALSLVGYLVSIPGSSEFAKFCIWFCFFNLLPISNLDGNKIFFGNMTLWTILSIITVIALAYTFVI